MIWDEATRNCPFKQIIQPIQSVGRTRPVHQHQVYIPSREEKKKTILILAFQDLTRLPTAQHPLFEDPFW